MTQLTNTQIELLTTVSENPAQFITVSDNGAVARQDVAELLNGFYTVTKVENGYRTVLNENESGVWETMDEAVSYLTDKVQDDAQFILDLLES